MLIALVCFAALLRIPAPLGRFSNTTWGKSLSNKVGWCIMELPALLLFPLIVIIIRTLTWQHFDFFLVAILVMWSTHYLHRSLIYPCRIRTKGKKIPYAVVAMALFYNIMNGLFLAYWYAILYLPPLVNGRWMLRALLGLLLFVGGMAINIYHDNRLINLRTSGTGYQIPYGGLFKFFSSPNLIGEVVEWIGFALFCWSLPGVAMALWTAANLVPRIYSVHRWYHAHFPNYPPERVALFPKFGSTRDTT